MEPHLNMGEPPPPALPPAPYQETPYQPTEWERKYTEAPADYGRSYYGGRRS